MSEIQLIKEDDGRKDIGFGFKVNGKMVKACTVHQEFLDVVGIPEDKREQTAQGLSQLMVGMLKPFMELGK